MFMQLAAHKVGENVLVMRSDRSWCPSKIVDVEPPIPIPSSPTPTMPTTAPIKFGIGTELLHF